MIYKYVNGVPLFNTKYKAMKWGSKYDLTGYHTQDYNGRTGYMAGANYHQAFEAFSSMQTVNGSDQQTTTTINTINQQSQAPSPLSITTPPTPTTSGGGGGY